MIAERLDYGRMGNNITYFARTNFRNQNQRFGIRQADRAYSMLILGATGSGKTSLLKTCMLDDMQAGRGFAFLDPHSDATVELLAQVPEHRKSDVIHFDIANPDLQLKYNPFRKVSVEKRALVGGSLLDVFRKLFKENWGARLEHVLRYSILTLLDQPLATLEDLQKLLLDKKYRAEAIQYITNDSTKLFWQKEFPEYTKADILPVLNKLGSLLAYPVIKRVLCTNKTEVSLRSAIDSNKLLMINLNRGLVGSDVVEVLGGFFLASIANAGYSRADIPHIDRKPFAVFIDESGLFATESIASMLSELRKFGIHLTCVAQFLGQYSPDVATALMANIGTLISFRLGVEDAKIVRLKMDMNFGVQDFVSLPNYCIYLKMMIDGTPSRAFSAYILSQNK